MNGVNTIFGEVVHSETKTDVCNIQMDYTSLYLPNAFNPLEKTASEPITRTIFVSSVTNGLALLAKWNESNVWKYSLLGIGKRD